MSNVSRLVYSPLEAADALGVNRATIYHWIQEGRIAATKLGPRIVRIPSGELERLVADGSMTVDGTSS